MANISTYIAEDYSFTIYLKEISKTKALSSEEEIELTRRIKQGDEEALNKLVKANLRFVVSVARNYQNQGLPLSDLVNEGNIGLIRAAKRFDETREFRFISYAVWWVRQAILQALAEHSRIVKLPVNKIGNLHKQGKSISELEQKLGRTPTKKEIAEHMGISEDEVENLMKIGTNHVSLDMPVNDDESSSVVDLIKDNSIETPEKRFLKKKLLDDIERIFSQLPPRDADILKMYFGIGYEMSYNLEEIGEKYNLTRERVRQIKEKALQRLRKSKKADILREYLGKI